MRDELLTKLESIIHPVAAKYETKPEWWIRGDDTDESLSYCYECAEKAAAEKLKENPDGEYRPVGGYGTDGDSQAFCEACQHPLDNSYTEYACECELDHFEEHGFNPSSPSDCHSMREILSTCGWDGEHSERIQALAAKIIQAAATA